MNPTVEILLSTYNGEKFLVPQLESILQQDYSKWRLVIRDDGSTDGTVLIINNYIQKYPEKISLITDSAGNLGYSGSFSKLLQQSTADYMMFCDQDDYWYPDKVSSMLSVMLEEEVNLPLKAHVVFSDLEVTDSELNVTARSFLKVMSYSPKKGMQVFFLKNYVPGCSLLFNRTLVQQALKTANIIQLHDHWLLMVCCSSGKVTYINKPLMKYRVHDNNAIGFMETRLPIFNRTFALVKDVIKYGFNNKSYRKNVYSKNIEQMQNICKYLGAAVLKEAIAFSNIDNSFYFSRKIKNIMKPYVLEKSVLKQITYIICF